MFEQSLLDTNCNVFFTSGLLAELGHLRLSVPHLLPQIEKHVEELFTVEPEPGSAVIDLLCVAEEE